MPYATLPSLEAERPYIKGYPKVRREPVHIRPLSLPERLPYLKGIPN